MITIAGRSIGPGQPCFVIAECGVAHNGDIRLAEKLIAAAKQAGADAVKTQTWRTSRLLSPDSPAYRTLLPLELSEGQLRHLALYAAEQGITFLSTPDQAEDADFLDELGVPAFKIGSGNLRNPSFLRHVAAKGKPIILSTGTGDMAEVEAAVRAIEDAGNRQLAILHCTSKYADEEEVRGRDWWDPAWCNLRAMVTLEQFGYPIGLSDHSKQAAMPAIALGASIYEIHLRLYNHPGGPDAAVSVDEMALEWIVNRIRWVEAALGDGVKRALPEEEDCRAYTSSWRT